MIKKLCLVLYSAIQLSHGQQIKLDWDNDYFAFQLSKDSTRKDFSDDNYSNGFHLQYSEDDEDYFIGHQIYTPHFLVVDFLIKEDRPYAGFLYGGYSKHYYSDTGFIVSLPNHTCHKLTLGIIGPSSKAENIQKSWHKTFQDYPPSGWDYQLKDEPILNYGFLNEYDLFTDRKGYKLLPYIECNVGNELIDSQIGYKFKIGKNIPPINKRYEKDYSYMFFGSCIDYVYRNIFLDGNTFEDSHSVEKESVIYKNIIGYEKKYKTIGIGYEFNTSSKEFKYQRDDSDLIKGHSYGKVSFSYNF